MIRLESPLFILPTQHDGWSRDFMKDKILCFACAVKNIETTFNTYYDLQDHLYRDHDMKKDPAMDIFNKYKTTMTKDQTTTPQS